MVIVSWGVGNAGVGKHYFVTTSGEKELNLQLIGTSPGIQNKFHVPQCQDQNEI